MRLPRLTSPASKERNNTMPINSWNHYRCDNCGKIKRKPEMGELEQYPVRHSTPGSSNTEFTSTWMVFCSECKDEINKSG